MTYPDQTIMAGGDVPGNCFQAALAGVLGVSINAVPHFPLLGIHHWLSACVAWLEAEHRLIVNTSPDPTLGKVRQLHIINGQSPRGYSHAVVGDTDTGDMVHDPHPSRAGLTFINSRFYFHQKPEPQRWRFDATNGDPETGDQGDLAPVDTDGVLACPPAGPVAWEYRTWRDGRGGEPVGWGAWERVQPKGLQSMDDAVQEMIVYIRRGYRYELRSLYAVTHGVGGAHK